MTSPEARLPDMTGNTVADSLPRSFLARIADWAHASPDEPALLRTGADPLTFAQLEQHVESMSRGLRSLGIEAGDIIAVAIPPGPELLIALLGIMRVAAAAPLEWNSTDAELRARLSATPARCLITLAGSAAAAAAHESGLPRLEIGADFVLRAPSDDLARGTTPLPAPDGRGAAPDTALIVRTSATTGTSKLVPLTHRNLDAICEGIRRSLSLQSADRYLSVMPLHHIVGFSCAMAQWMAGGSVACPPGFDVLTFPSLLEEFRPSWYSGGPAVHRAVLQLALDQPERFARHSLRFIRCGTGAASGALLEALENTLRVTVIYGYGLTEVGTVTNTRPHLPRKPGSVGPSIGPEIRIVDSAGHPLPPGAEGEVAIRGDAVMPGYLDDPGATAEVLRGGWLHTGDLGRMDEDGDLFITGRIKEIINRGGESIAPVEIDHALADHPAVAHAAAFPVPHPSLGEDVAAAIVLRPGATATPAEIRAFLAARLSRARIPSAIHFTDSLPLSDMGKPLRKALADRFARAMDDAHSGPPASAPSRSPHEERIASIWASLLGVEVPEPDDDFFALGGDSLSAARMIASVEEQFDLRGRLWEQVQFFDSPTVSALARIVAVCEAALDSAPPDLVEKRFEDASAVFLESRGEDPPIFFFPGEGIGPWFLRHLVKNLGPTQPFIALQHKLSAASEFEGFARKFTKLILELRPAGPLALAGHCYGGLLAYEVAQRLAALGRTPFAVILIETATPGYPKIRPRNYLRSIPGVLAALGKRGPREFAKDVRSHLLHLRAGRFTLTAPDPRISPVATLSPGAVVLRSYRPRPFPGSLATLRAGGVKMSHQVLEDPRLGWKDFVRGSFQASWIPGRHNSLFDAENAPKVAEVVDAILLQRRG